MPPISRAQAAAEILRRRAARNRLLEFTKYTYPGGTYDASWHHGVLCDYLDRFAAGELNRLAVFMPPRHGKSELCSRRLPAYILGRNPDLQILACSNTASLASAMNRDVQRVMDTPAYARLFPGTLLSSRNVRATAGPMALRNSDIFEVVGRRGSYRNAGVTGAIVGHGFDVGVIDDPFTGREAADSPTQRAAVWRWYTGDFYTRRAQGARILLVTTRWHPEDLAGMLLKQSDGESRADTWTVLRLPAVCEVEDRHAADPRQPGEALWPNRYPLAELEKTQAANPYDWWSQYQQRPRNPGSTEWPESYFGRAGFWFDDWPDPQTLDVKVIALDPSKGKESKTGDYQALIKFARGRDGTEYVEADMGKRPMTAMLAADNATELSEGMVETAVDTAAAFAPECLAVEVNQFQELLLIPIAQVAARRKIELRVRQIENTVNKHVRIRRLGPALAQGRMRFKRQSLGTAILVEQLKQFPSAEHDDGPDALEMARRTAIELFNQGDD